MKRTEAIEREKHLHAIVRRLKRAAKKRTWDGRSVPPYECSHTSPDLGVSIIFTRDVGYHTSGWWKNPDYERCYHLSLGFYDPIAAAWLPRNPRESSLLVEIFFGRDKRMLWVEPPYSDDGKRKGIWHYRLFCSSRWEPIQPRGEVYNRELTEAGWKSWSDAQAELLAEAIERQERSVT